MSPDRAEYLYGEALFEACILATYLRLHSTWHVKFGRGGAVITKRLP